MFEISQQLRINSRHYGQKPLGKSICSTDKQT